MPRAQDDHREGAAGSHNRSWTWYDVYPGVLLGAAFAVLVALAVASMFGWLF